MNIVILGCGRVGTLLGEALVGRGDRVIGVRRQPAATEGAVEMVAGDIAEPSLHGELARRMPHIDAAILAANPGLRRGRDNRLARAAALFVERHPAASFVYTATAAVYGDARGGGVSESAAIDREDPVIDALMAIEDAVFASARGVVLRATALVGAGRARVRDRLRAAAEGSRPCEVIGGLERPFSYIHEADLADVCELALDGGLPGGVYNVAAPEVMTLRDYYQRVARHYGITAELKSDGSNRPERWIDASRLHRLLPGKIWRGLFAS